MTPVLVLCILLCAASAAPAEKHNLPADVSEPQEEMMRMMVKEEEQELPKDLVPELRDGEESRNMSMTAESERAESPQGLSLCAEGWQLYSGVCYKVFTFQRPWVQAVRECHRHGAHLASAPTEWQYGFLQGLTANAGAAEAWLGGFYVQGVWVWADELPFSYDGWRVRNSVPENPCLFLHSDAGWENTDCTDYKYFICAKSEC